MHIGPYADATKSVKGHHRVLDNDGVFIHFVGIGLWFCLSGILYDKGIFAGVFSINYKFYSPDGLLFTGFLTATWLNITVARRLWTRSLRPRYAYFYRHKDGGRRMSAYSPMMIAADGREAFPDVDGPVHKLAVTGLRMLGKNRILNARSLDKVVRISVRKNRHDDYSFQARDLTAYRQCFSCNNFYALLDGVDQLDLDFPLMTQVTHAWVGRRHLEEKLTLAEREISDKLPHHAALEQNWKGGIQLFAFMLVLVHLTEPGKRTLGTGFTPRFINLALKHFTTVRFGHTPAELGHILNVQTLADQLTGFIEERLADGSGRDKKAINTMLFDFEKFVNTSLVELTQAVEHAKVGQPIDLENVPIYNT